VAAIVYGRGRHVINLFVWPGSGELGPTEAKPGDGYTLLHWTRGGMTFWAVSDVDEKDLQAFRQRLQLVITQTRLRGVRMAHWFSATSRARASGYMFLE
jgi:anti-sigma factor RsiW